MLALKRNKKESIIVTFPEGKGCTMVIEVLRLGNKQVQLGFVAPTRVKIHRTELLGQERKSNNGN